VVFVAMCGNSIMLAAPFKKTNLKSSAGIVKVVLEL